MTNPSEKINNIILSLNDIELILLREAERVINIQNELAKQKYVCPNCHRITDKILPKYEAADSGRIGDMTLKVVTGCKHCLTKN